MKTNLILWGAAGHARVLRELAESIGYTVIAVFDNNSAATSPFTDVPLYYGRAGFENWRAQFRGDAKALVAIGGSHGRDRLEIQQFLADNGFAPATVVHPTAFVAADVQLGPGTQILAMSAVCASARIGSACIVNTAASVDHECEIADGVHIAPGAILTGNVSVGRSSFIGAGAVILPRIRIGTGAIVGAGAVVASDVGDGATVAGVPARPLR